VAILEELGHCMKKQAKGIGLAIVGGGRVGLFRGEVAARHPAVEWIGLAEKNPNRAGEVGPKISADFVTQSHVELLKRPEVTCAIIATDGTCTSIRSWRRSSAAFRC
jgi:predicted dehydrogenase